MNSLLSEWIFVFSTVFPGLCFPCCVAAKHIFHSGLLFDYHYYFLLNERACVSACTCMCCTFVLRVVPLWRVKIAGFSFTGVPILCASAVGVITQWIPPRECAFSNIVLIVVELCWRRSRCFPRLCKQVTQWCGAAPSGSHVSVCAEVFVSGRGSLRGCTLSYFLFCLHVCVCPHVCERFLLPL